MCCAGHVQLVGCYACLDPGEVVNAPWSFSVAETRLVTFATCIWRRGHGHVGHDLKL